MFFYVCWWRVGGGRECGDRNHVGPSVEIIQRMTTHRAIDPSALLAPTHATHRHTHTHANTKTKSHTHATPCFLPPALTLTLITLTLAQSQGWPAPCPSLIP